jgi:hypothetical protein
MTRAQSQYLRIYDAVSNVTYARWQSYYVNTTVTWNTQSWSYIPFNADGITEGNSGEESAINVVAPATSVVVSVFNNAIREGHLVELSLYQFEQQLGDDEPQASQELITVFYGQVVGGSSTLTKMTIQLGSALGPIGAQVPPRKFSTAMIGFGCKL